MAKEPADHVERYAERLRTLVGQRAVRLSTTDGEVEAAYRLLRGQVTAR